MKTLAILLLPVFLLAAFLNMDIFNLSKTNYAYSQGEPPEDTLTDAPNSGTPGDASGLFNERGFYSSSSSSINENEVISNFNGNLQYSIPLYDFKGAGDLNINMALNYNGSINYKIIAAKTGSTIHGPFNMYNINAPGWILSLNGFAVQMTNFETDFFTNSNSLVDSNVIGNNVRILASGYHITDELKGYENAHEARIFIMKGDGSLITLKRVSDGPCDSENLFPDCYIGEFYSEDKQSYTRAVLEFMNNDYQQHPSYRNRRMYLMQGDGITYIFEEHKGVYEDFPNNTDHAGKRPQSFLLVKIKDRFGREIKLDYNLGIKGRPILQNIVTNYDNAGISLNWSPMILDSLPTSGLRITGGGKQFKLLFDQQTNIGFDNPTGTHRPVITKIVNPVGDVIDINYNSYTRIARSLYNPIANSNPRNMRCTLQVKRMTQFNNYNGGTYNYYYFNGTSDMTLGFNPAEENKIRSAGSDYKGSGRDLFFTNMIDSVTYINQGVHTKTANYDYNYNANGRSDSMTKLIDIDDMYSTTKYILSRNHPSGGINDSVTGTSWFYKQYPINVTASGELPPDFEGYTKLEKDINFNDNYEAPSKQTEYFFEQVSTVDGIFYNSSFLDTAVLETMYPASVSPVSKRTAYRYQYAATPISDKNRNNPITEKTEIDAFKNKTIVSNLIIYANNYYYPNAVYHPSFPNDYDTSKLYIINMPDTVWKFNVMDTVLAKTVNVYASDNSNANGYLGQLLTEKNYNKMNLSESKEIKYYYNKKDTLGSFLFGEMYKPGTEGSLRMTEDPLGNKTKYYYHNIEKSQNNIEGDFSLGNTGSVSYRKVFTNNSIVKDSSSNWFDLRLPVRTDNYVNSGYPLTTYTEYNIAGIPDQQINHNNYYSFYRFDGIDRMKEGTLPYDFTTPIQHEIVDTVYDEVILTMKPEAVTTIDKLNNQQTCYYTFTSNCAVPSGWFGSFSNFQLKLQHPGGVPDAGNIEDKVPLIKFSHPNLHPDSLTEILDARLIISPYRFFRETAGDTSLAKVNVSFYTLLSFPGVNGYTFTKSTDFVNSDVFGTMYGGSYVYNEVNLTSLLQKEVIENGNPFNGVTLNAYTDTDGLIELPVIDYNLELGGSLTGAAWCDTVETALIVKAVRRRIVTHFVNEYSNATIRNSYDDANNIVTAEQKIGQSNVYKKLQNKFDGFYRLNKTKIFTDTSTFDSTQIKYNYLDQKYETIDGKSNSTKFTYDAFSNVAKTTNADNSVKLDTLFFRDGYYYSFGNIPGLVSIQRFTDETGRKYFKILDAMGNLRRETSLVENPNSQVLTPDTMHTDYKLDALYRVIEVKTPADKHIYYSYDGYGRQSQRTTPDAGTVKYRYDKNGNMVLSQDAKQAAQGTNVYTVRTFDGLNRLTGIRGLQSREGDTPEDFDELTGDENFVVDFMTGDNPPPNDYLILNVYDTLANSSVQGFFTAPGDYSSAMNNTRGALVATAYRTLTSDPWNFKWYRYDARGRVIKMWHMIDGYDTKAVEYMYNSSNQVILTKYQDGENDSRLFKNTLDEAGRLKAVDYWIYSNPPDTGILPDGPTYWKNLTSFTYNPNSQIDQQSYNLTSDQLSYIYEYNSRNWITVYDQLPISEIESPEDPEDIFRYVLDYQANGNISAQGLSGLYDEGFSNRAGVGFEYTYDLSNRLIYADGNAGESGDAFDVINTYDKDGNILTMTRDNNAGSPVDVFTYNYTSGTNRLTKVSGSTAQFAYDNNGNMISDSLNNNDSIEYDNRNLITRIRRYTPEDLFTPPQTLMTMYQYDDAGNRTRKAVYLSTQSDPDPINHITDAPSMDWSLIRNEFYIRGIDGNVIAEYNSTELEHWNLYAGTDNFGKIDSSGAINYYLKDHLGSTRVIIDNSDSPNIISAQDYDPWGYLLAGRQTNSQLSEYKFTGKERDNESNYDYFGARYYDARIGRWGQTEPLVDKYINWSPYCYSINSPLSLLDNIGLNPEISIEGKTITVSATFFYTTKSADSKFGLEADQIKALYNMVNNMNSIESTVSIFNESYNVVMDIQINNTMTDKTFSQLDVAAAKSGEPFMFAADATNFANSDFSNVLESNVGVGITGNTLVMLTGDKLKPYPNTGQHELAHGLGIAGHPEDLRSDPDIPSLMETPVIKNGVFQRTNFDGKIFERIFEKNNIDPTKNGTHTIER